MHFSVLMSVYIKEKPQFLKESLNSVFNQTLPPDEVILVEDGPLTDELYSTIKDFTEKHEKLKIVPLNENHGLGYALNIGLKHCKYNLVARMDSDDICKPYRFEKEITFMHEHKDIDICSSWIDEFENDKNNVVSQRRIPETHEEIIKYAKYRCPVNHPTVVYKRDKIIQLGGYQDFPEDYYLWIKMIMNGCKFYNIQESLLFFRFSSDLYKRRGGWKYAKDDIRAQINFYKVGFLNKREFLYNASIRSTVRLIPVHIRAFIYKYMLRKRKIFK
ncbi:glycosyltransferase [uncultured Prevotella sp.]|uniref:glycosyltransferase family 2 protein n=1 Tax=uncultured Prevotella sp. TaxID=159272 RepID=UPI00262E8A7C|nr:glycosyltransferase [uncultured Prevotella sp.]